MKNVLLSLYFTRSMLTWRLHNMSDVSSNSSYLLIHLATPSATLSVESVNQYVLEYVFFLHFFVCAWFVCVCVFVACVCL